MNEYSYRWYPKTTPRAVENGLKARSARGSIGESWWSRRFVDVLESFAIGTRLTRGRSYARRGQVISVTVTPGVVTASVQGSRPRPYRVSIGFPPLPEPAWARVERALAEQALFSARLLAGEVPHELESVFGAEGTPLFPRRLTDLELYCSCPDFAIPCKHLAATFYLLAEAFDDDPFQILHWRGRSKDELLGALRTLRSGAGAAREPIEQEGLAAPGALSAGLALADLASVPLAESVDRFWLPPQPLGQRAPVLAIEPDLLLRQLPAPGDRIGGRQLLDRLLPAYQDFGSTESGLFDPGSARNTIEGEPEKSPA